jgi:hypothetical protein
MADVLGGSKATDLTEVRFLGDDLLNGWTIGFGIAGAQTVITYDPAVGSLSN